MTSNVSTASTAKIGCEISGQDMFCHICHNLMYPSNMGRQAQKGGNTEVSILDSAAEMLATTETVSRKDLKKRFNTDIDMLSILRTKKYKAETVENRELIYNHVYSMLTDAERKNTSMLKELRNPDLNEIVHYLECAKGHNRQPLKPACLYQRSSNTTKVQTSQSYPMGVFRDPILERWNGFKCADPDCGFKSKEVQSYLKEEHPGLIPGRGVKFVREDHTAQWVCCYCDARDYMCFIQNK